MTDDPKSAALPDVSSNKVGCENASGTLNIHFASETCEVCSPPAEEPAPIAYFGETLRKAGPPPAAGTPYDAEFALSAIALKHRIRIRVVVDTERPGIEGHPIALHYLETEFYAAGERIAVAEAKIRDCEAEHPPEPWAAELEARCMKAEERARLAEQERKIAQGNALAAAKLVQIQSAEVERLQGELAGLREAFWRDMGDGPQCRACWQYRKEPHMQACWIGAVLGETR